MPIPCISTEYSSWPSVFSSDSHKGRVLGAKGQGISSIVSPINHGSHICEVTYSLEFIHDPKINSNVTFVVIHDKCWVVKNWSHWYARSQVRLNRTMFCLLFQVLDCKEVSFSGYYTTSSTIWGFWGVVLLFKMAPWIIALKRCLDFPSARRLWCASWKKYLC